MSNTCKTVAIMFSRLKVNIAFLSAFFLILFSIYMFACRRLANNAHTFVAFINKLFNEVFKWALFLLCFVFVSKLAQTTDSSYSGDKVCSVNRKC